MAHAQHNAVVVGEVYIRREPVCVLVQGVDDLGVRFTYGGSDTRFLGEEEFRRRFTASSEIDDLRAENERLRADRLALYVWVRHVDWSECDLSEWLNNKPIGLCIPDSNAGHDAARELYRELGGEDGFDYAKLRALSKESAS